MNQHSDIMRFESTLPSDFSGIFYFTNPSEEDFIGVWAKKEYLFPAKSTTPLIIIEHSPLQIQHIRKKFAKDLAEREFYKSKGYRMLQAQEGKPGNRSLNSIHQAAAYTMDDLTPYIQKCLIELAPSEMRSRPVVDIPLEERLTRNEEGALNTEAVDSKRSLRQKALES